MRISTYELMLPLTNEEGIEYPDHVLLVNGLYGSVDVIGRNNLKKLQAGAEETLSPSLLERLMTRGHLTTHTPEEERQDMKLLGRIYRILISRNNFTVYILPTYNCNFRCPYCFERHRLHNGQEWLHTTMSPAMIDALFDALRDIRSKGRILQNCTLYGGEPMLKENLPVIQIIAEKCQEMNLDINAVTNGYDLDAYMDLMEKYHFSHLQITVDGAGPVNDALRVHRDGVGSYEQIMHNIELALERGIEVSMRVNVGRNNLAGMKDLIQDLQAQGFIDKEKERAASLNAAEQSGRGRFSYYFKAVESNDTAENSVAEQEIMEELLRIGFTAKEAIQHESQYSTPAELFRDSLTRQHYPQISTAFCGAELGMVGVDPFGNLYSCWDQVAKEDAVIGKLYPEERGFLWNFEKARWLTRTSDQMTACQDCPYIFICRGGCASRALARHGSPFREACEEIREIFAFVAPRIAGEVFRKTGNYELSLSWTKPLSRLSEKDRTVIMHTNSQKEIADILKEKGILDVFQTSEKRAKRRNS